ncbi:hypothetical protein QO010_000524 [Caulobacter ginsengisoli]|uniref:MmcQ/YjbR family DNA-binding protein n=1 Tax=Caulobacter ginsengisoli TaxID=400775 RepID=A0ABU0IL78_9CAUL|nr:MmcQ/YjbR family DNA-binding protein [Caulobacter ginsengisoli]MDQ0462776.1 hypothetical protein [Caulobacter ginsengisoli]
MTEAELRALALSLPETLEVPHFPTASFRVRGKIYLTIGEGRDDTPAVLRLPAHIQEAVLQSDADTAESVGGYWGRMGWTRFFIERMENEKLADLVRLAWRQVAPKKLISGGAG